MRDSLYLRYLGVDLLVEDYENSTYVLETAGEPQLFSKLLVSNKQELVTKW